MVAPCLACTLWKHAITNAQVSALEIEDLTSPLRLCEDQWPRVKTRARVGWQLGGGEVRESGFGIYSFGCG